MNDASDHDAIERALSSPDAEDRRRATSQLPRLPLERAQDLLLRALGDDDWRVRKEATLAARSFGPDEALLAALVRELGGGDNIGLRNAAVDVLASAGQAATARLTEALSSLDADGRKLVVETLGRARDPGALDALEAALADPDANVRQGAIEAVAGLGTLARDRVQEILLSRLDDRDRFVQLTTLEGLCALEAAVPWERLAPLLEDATLRPAALSVAALTESPAAARALARMLASARGVAFTHALKGLTRLADGRLAAGVAEALAAEGPALAARLVALACGEGDDATPSRRAMALRLAAAAGAPGFVSAAVGALGEDALAEQAQAALVLLGAPALPEMLDRLFDANVPAETRAVLVDVIAAVAGNASDADSLPIPIPYPHPHPDSRFPIPIPSLDPGPALGALRAASRDPERPIAARALLALSRLGRAEDLELCAEQTLSEARPVALAAEAALAALTGRYPEAARVLADRLARAEELVLPAAIVLGALGAVSASEERDATFLAHAATAGDPRARRAAVEAVSELCAAAAFPGAMEVLRLALADEEREVQMAAARALGRLCTAPDGPRAPDVLDLAAEILAEHAPPPHGAGSG